MMQPETNSTNEGNELNGAFRSKGVRQRRVGALIIVILLVISSVFVWQLRTSLPDGPSSQAGLAKPTNGAPHAVLREPDLPDAYSDAAVSLAATAKTLAGSDWEVLRAANDLAPQLARWLANTEQIRKWVALVAQIADGKLPQQNRPLEYPMAAFAAKQTGDRLVPDPLNYRRTNHLITVLTNLSPVQLAKYYHAWYPVLGKAYAELGMRGQFDEKLRAAIEQLRSVQPLSVPPVLVSVGGCYKFSDPALERASEVQKLLWRLGPDNAKQLQDYLGRLEQHI